MKPSTAPTEDDIIVNSSDIDEFDYDEVLKYLLEEEENGIESHASDSEEDVSEDDEIEPEVKPQKKEIKEDSRKRKPKPTKEKKEHKKKSKTKEKDADFALNTSEDEEEIEAAEVQVEDSDTENNNNAAPKKTKGYRGTKSKRKPKKDVYVLEECELDDETLESDIKWKPVPSTPPENLSPTTKMLKFQLESLTWLGQQEENPRFRGGILADDMGMGKTLQAIALLLSRKAPEEEKVKATLVICPVVALTQWQNEILKYTKPDSLSVTVYHGSSRITDAEELSKYDVVLTSYSIVETEWRHQHTGYKRKGETIKKPSLVHSIDWYRIILDEAHSIKDRNSNSAKAVFNLQSQYRLTLTGTPLQNRIGELFSIIKFLKVVPYSFYYCKKCDCRSHSWLFEAGHSRARKCLQCDHTAMSHFAWWNKNVMNPIGTYGMNHDRSKRAIRVLKFILTQLMLRRTKVEKAQDMCLPPRIITVRNDQLDPLENDFYEALYTQSKTQFNDFVDQGTILNNYAHVFDLLLRLRQAVDHPYLVLHSKNRDSDKGGEWCGICHEQSEDPIQSRCKHTFCRSCIETYVQSSSNKKPNCPTCFIPLTIDLKQKTLDVKSESKGKTILQRIDLTNWRTSTKIEAVMEELEKTKSRDPNAKTLIFSQFVNFLDLIEWRLRLAGFGCVKLDGRMNSQQKDAAIQKFNTDPDTSVFLISLKAGGVALNLTAASQCFLLDPWWNPAAEFQAIDRVYRLGQYKCISVIRFIIPNTIEDRIMQLQEKKHLLFNSTVGMDQDALARLSLGDLKFLFRC